MAQSPDNQAIKESPTHPIPMKVLSLSAGAASMYCGSCMRDNALAAELIRQGHDVTLLPFYTPTLTDEENVSRQERVFFGGISVYLEQHVPWFRSHRLLDGLLDAPGVITAFTSGSIAVDPRQLGAMTVSTLKGADGHQRKETAKLIEFVTSEPPPDVVNVPYTLLINLAAPLKRALNRPVVVTLQGEDLFLEALPEPYKTEALELVRSQVGEVDLFIAVSDYYARFMRDYLRIPESKMRVARLGVNVRDLTVKGGLAPNVANATFGASPQLFTIGYFARVAPEKGLHNLAEAYRILRTELGMPAGKLVAAGYLPPEHRPYLQQIVRRLSEAGLGDEFVYRGTVERSKKVQFFHDIDLLSVPSPYHEPKGLYLLEAMACGVPVVQPNHGAFPEIIERTGGGVLAKSDHGRDVAEAIAELWRDPARARQMGQRAAESVRNHYTVGHMADAVLNAYRDATLEDVSHSRG
ncbi:MAG: glycosyltransferase family 4 protein [Acidimicrobiia bacterium]|nr:glycosyltransferase family 4 protein [Acidimicrobiia bacterium]